MEAGDDMRPEGSPDDELDTLLGLADGPRELSPIAEDRLLRSILRTAAQPRVPEEFEHHEAEAIELATRRAPTPGWLKVAAALALAASVAMIAILGRGATPSAVEPIGGGEAFVLDVEDADGSELCNAIAITIARSRLYADDVNVDRADNQLPLDLAELLEELTARVTADQAASGISTNPTPAQLDDISAAAAALRLQAALLDNGDSAGAARARQRATTLLLPLLPLDETVGCPPPTTSFRPPGE